MRHSLDENFPANEDRDIIYAYDNLNRLIQEDADSNGDGYTTDYEYNLVGNRTERIVNVNFQTLTTVYNYDPNTDRLLKETHSGPVYSFIQGNEQYYAYVGTGIGKPLYYKDLHGNKVGPVKAFFTGLPSVWSRYLFVLLMALLPVMLFMPGVVGVIRRLVFCYGRPPRLRPHIPRKGICLLIAFVMLFGPEHFGSLAQADVQYANLSTATWAQGDTTIEYTYDANGSVETKTTKVTSTQAVEETVTYEYNLQNRLAIVTTEDTDGDQHIVEYTYNDEGIRVQAYSYDIPYGQSIQNEKTVVYLVDEYNHTGYAQTLEELTFNKADPDPLTETPDSLTTYLIGDDVIAQTKDTNTQYLLYDGHGSTRQLAEYDTSVTIADSYSYDGYGVMLQDDTTASSNPGKVSQQDTNLLYTGEHFDTDAQQYYFRARYYNPSNGLFNRMDPYSGNTSDPQSLHKYLYCHANPVNGVDPTGNFMTMAGAIAAVSIQAMTFSIMLGAVMNVYTDGKVVSALSSYVSHLFDIDTWIDAASSFVSYFVDLLSSPLKLVKEILLWVARLIFPIVSLLMAAWNMFKMAGFLRDLVQIGLSPEQLGRGMATMTASIIFIVAVRKGIGIFNRGGSYGALKGSRLSKEVAHEMPQSGFMTGILGFSKRKNPALGMLKIDHKLTRTFCGRGSRSLRIEKGLTARQRLALDVKDVRTLFGTKYNKGLREVIGYAKTHQGFNK